MYETVLLDLRDGIATVTLNRPAKLNAYTPQMGDEIVASFAQLRTDPAARVVILTGAGRGFCAGVDLDVLRQSRAGKETRLIEQDFLRKFPLELAAFPKPVIAAINGAAIGVGVTMTLPCDVRLAAQGAKLGVPFTRLGLLPGLGSTHWLPRLVGMARAQELVLTGRTILAEEAREIGLVNRVLPAESLLDSAREMARTMTESSPEALARAKAALHYGAGANMEAAMRNEEAESAALRRDRTEHSE